MLDDEVTIMNEISRPPPPPPPAADTGRRHASHWDRQGRSNSENGKNTRRKDSGRGFPDRNRENMREPDHMERHMGYQGNSGNDVQTSMHNIGGTRGNQMHGGIGDVNNMGMAGGNINIGEHHRVSSSMDGSNMNITSGGHNMNMNTRMGAGMNMNISGNTGMAVSSGMSSMPASAGNNMINIGGSMPMQISPTGQSSQWLPNMPASGGNMPNMNMSQPVTSMSQPPMQSLPPPMMPPPALQSRGPDGQMIGPIMPGMDPMNTQMMGSMMESGQGPCPMMDPSTGQMMPPWTLPSMVGPDGQLVKQPITYRLSVLYPPNPQAPPPTTRERPPGCRTVFIGGLPENAVEDHVVDVFSKCGEIQTVRMSKKNFCHIRYCAEYCVDNAIYLSGWRMRIDNSSDGPNTGRLHVDFAQARDDLYEWECKQRAAEREARHRNKIIQDMNRTPSPPPVAHFSDHEAHTVTEEIRAENSEGRENWGAAMDTLMTWLDRGDCNKKNAHTFYTMIQVASSHVKRLLGEQTEYEQELAKMKEDFRSNMTAITVQ